MSPVAPQKSSSRAIVVTDMSGFTRITRQYGIVHMASLIWKTRQVLRALFLSLGATRLAVEADNNLATFENPEAALAAALQVQRLIDLQNSTAPDESMQITMGGVGVGYGDVVDTEDLFAGGAFHEAFELAENISERGEVLVSSAVRDAVNNGDMLDKLNYDQRSHSDYYEGKETYYCASGEVMQPYPFDAGAFDALRSSEEVAPSVGVDEGNEVAKEFVALLMERFRTGVDGRAKIDKEIEGKLMKESGVMMCGVNWDKVARAEGFDKMLERQHKAHKIAEDIVSGLGGNVEGERLFVFDRELEAIAAALMMRKKYAQVGEDAFTGFGVHVGVMLYVPGTDVTWGDVVNTASKLGEDKAEGRQILVSKEAYSRATETAKTVGGEAAQLVLNATATMMEAFSVSGATMEAYTM